MRARLVKPVPPRRTRLISGDGRTRPVVGDVGETDQGFAGPFGRDMVLVYVVTPDGGSEWELEAYSSELEPLDPPTSRPPRPTGTAGKRTWIQRLFGHVGRRRPPPPPEGK